MERQRITSRLTGLAITIAIALGLVTTPATGQNTWHVPADFPAIQEAIDAASNGDEIIVAPGTYNEAINFGGKPIHLRSSDGPEVTIVDATGLFTSVVTCASGEGPDTILDGFTITGGDAQLGGGMLNSVSSPTVIDCIFTENLADWGGGMANIAGSAPVVLDTRFRSNTANADGGGMLTGGSTVTVIGCTFDDNVAGGEGGGMFIASNSSAAIEETLFCVNTPDHIVGPWDDLGGTHFTFLPCDNSCFGHCHGQTPGGCWCDEDCVENGDCCLDVCTLCDFHCGAIVPIEVPTHFPTIQQAMNFAADGDEIVVAPGTYNEAINFNGKAVHLRSSGGPEVTIIDASGLNTSVITCDSGEGPDTILDGFTITGGSANQGGGMRNIDSSPTVMNCIFAYNTATQGGGMFNSESAPAVTNCVFQSNSAFSGGGMFNSASNPTVTGCDFLENDAEFGGGMTNSNSSPIVHDCLFQSNSGGGGWGDEGGGGMYNSNSSPTVTNCVFESNTALANGGGMYNAGGGSPTISDSVFQNNTSNWLGGAIANNWLSNPNVTNCEFIANTAHLGGAMYTSDSTPSVTDSLFTGNTATFFPGSDSGGQGGALYNDWFGSPTVTNCVFDGNTADAFGGGMYNASSSSPTVTNSAFENNIANSNGGAIYSIPLGNASSGSCVGLCGGFSPDGCFCDEVCCDLGDCCSDKHEVCGGCDPAAASFAIGNTSFCDNTSCEVVGLLTDLGGNEFCNPDPRQSVLVPEDYSTIQAAILAMCEGEIIVAPGTYNEAINFGGKAIHLRSSDGPEVTIIDATGLDTSVVTCASGEGPDTILEGFTITGGAASHGGGLRNVGSSPTVTNCIFHGNVATNNGGGIHNTSSSNPTIEDSFFCENVPHHITGNWTDAEGNEFFAACPWTRPITVHVPGNYGTIQEAIDDVPWGSEIIVAPGTYNEAINFGGKAAHLHSSDGPEVTIIDGSGTGMSVIRCINGEGPETIIEGFTITGGDVHSGGGMRNNNSSPTIINCIFTGNQVVVGGGMYNSGSSPTIIDCIFDSNVALGGFSGGGNGGGMFNTSGSSPTISNSMFVGNSADSPTTNQGNGGGIWNGNNSTTTVTDCVFVANTATGNGGAIRSSANSSATIADTSFCDNSLCEIVGPRSDLGGNEFCNAAPPEVVFVPQEYVTIQAAIDSVGCEAEIIVAPGTYNEAINLRGKAIHLRSSDGPEVTTISAAGLNARVVTCNSDEWLDTIVEGFTITGGSPSSGSGGGMLNSGSSPTVVNCIFVNNSASSGGGMMITQSSSPLVTDCTFEGNTATFPFNSGGGGMSIAGSAGATVTNCIFLGNTASNDGGGMRIIGFASAGGVTVTNTLFEGNSAQNSGGGIFSTGASAKTVTNCVFKGNSANQGGGIWSASTAIAIGDSLFCESNPDHIDGPFDDLGGNEFLDVCPDCPADLTGPDGQPDGVVDVFDLLAVISDWGTCPDPNKCPADITGPADTPDGEVDVFDLLAVISEWGACP